MKTCPSCGEQNSERARFCQACATPLEAPAQSAREERKRVSVLFCDLVGFTGRAERLDPEEVRALLQPYHARVRSELERHGGTVEKFIGDAVVALFGAPTAHEDDPERAVRAALAIREAVTGEELQVRIGVTTGEALVALDARPESGEGMASGDVVNTAARLQSAAPVDGILVDETTYRATERQLEYREHPPVEAKGKSEPVPVWEALAARSRLGLDVGERTGTPLVGRERELELLTGALERARSERVVQLVTLVGVPGIGKSRLVLELFRRADEDPELIRWRQGRCLPYGEGVTLWALGEIVKAQAGVLETDTSDVAAAKLQTAVANAVGADGEAGWWVERHLRPLVGLGGEAETSGDQRDEAFAAWRRFFEGVAEEGPFVAVFEDLQWADDALLDFVDHLVEWSVDVPLLVVAIARPELLTRRPGWGGGKPNAVTHSLGPLTDEQTAGLVHALLRRSVLPVDVQRSLVANAGGNPLYAEEFARMLGERTGGDGEVLPESVQGIIAARLDALEPEEKALLQDAAVLGKVFWLGALAVVAGEERWQLERRLHALERREFVRRDRQSAVGGERQYAFRHLLVREVAYGQIPRARRAEKHAAVAGWIDTLSPDRTEDRAEMLAHHYRTALEYARAAGGDTGELADRARAAFVEAADRALALNSVGPAAEFYDEALKLWPAADEPSGELLLRYGRSLQVAGDERAEETLQRARERLRAAGDAVNEAFAVALLANVRWHRGDVEQSHEDHRRAVELVQAEPASETKARVLAQAASAKMVAGEDEEAIRLGREALAIAESMEIPELVAHLLDTIGSARGHSGDDGGIADLERAVEIALSVNSPEAARALNNLAGLVRTRGDLPRARATIKEGIRVGERFGAARIVHFLRSAEPVDAYFAGEWDEAIELADRFIAECELSPSYQEGGVRALRALVRVARGETGAAVEDIEHALELGRRIGEPQALAAPLGNAARVFLAAGEPNRARAAARELLELAREHPSLRGLVAIVGSAAHEVGIAAEALAVLGPPEPGEPPWRTAGRAQLEDRLLEAAEIFAAMPQLPEEALARLSAAEQLLQEGRRPEADAQLRQALAFFRSVGAALYARRAEQLLAASA